MSKFKVGDIVDWTVPFNTGVAYDRHGFPEGKEYKNCTIVVVSPTPDATLKYYINYDLKGSPHGVWAREVDLVPVCWVSPEEQKQNLAVYKWLSEKKK
jgi:hypothetical protein